VWWLFLIYSLDDGSRIERPFWAWDTEQACIIEGKARVNGVTIVDYVCRYRVSDGEIIEG
jgi:hypothetical protein